MDRISTHLDPALVERVKNRLGITGSFIQHMQRERTGETARERAAIEAQAEATAAEQERLVAEEAQKQKMLREHRLAEAEATMRAGIAASQERADAARDALEQARWRAMQTQRPASPGELHHRADEIARARASMKPEKPSPDHDPSRPVPLR